MLLKSFIIICEVILDVFIQWALKQWIEDLPSSAGSSVIGQWGPIGKIIREDEGKQNCENHPSLRSSQSIITPIHTDKDRFYELKLLLLVNDYIIFYRLKWTEFMYVYLRV